jgi:hypothetical protein
VEIWKRDGNMKNLIGEMRKREWDGDKTLRNVKSSHVFAR